MDEEMVRRVERWCDENGMSVIAMYKATGDEAEADVALPIHGTATLSFTANGDALDVSMTGIC